MKLSRPVRAGEAFNPQELNKSGAMPMPDGGVDLVSLQVNVGAAAAGRVGPGSRANIHATRRVGKKVEEFPLLVNMFVVAVDTYQTPNKDGALTVVNMVSFALTERQTLLVGLAKNRGCTLELELCDPTKGPEAFKDYDFDEVVKRLSDEVGDATPVEVAPPPRPVGEPR
jgi:Flp pilus assembly protein CpaB